MAKDTKRKTPRSQLAVQVLKMFGKQLRKARERAGYKSAQRFAGVLGQAPHTYRHWERGDTEPDFEQLTRICELLKISPNDLLPMAAGNGRLEASKADGRKTAA